MRNSFVQTLTTLARQDQRVILLTGDLGFGVLNSFIKEFPHQFINAGIAEQNMVGVAAGLAKEGLRPVLYSIANFPSLRCLEQIRNDISYHNLNVKIVSVGAGLAYGAAGFSHFATEDLAIMRALPNMTIFSPADPFEAEAVTRAAFAHVGPCYIRLGKGNEPNLHSEPLSNYKLGAAIPHYPIESSSPLTAHSPTTVFLATGAITANAIAAASSIGALCYSFPTIVPLDIGIITKVATDFERIVTVEEHHLPGGFGSSVAECLASLPLPRATLVRLGLSGYVIENASRSVLLALHQLSAEGILNAIK